MKKILAVALLSLVVGSCAYTITEDFESFYDGQDIEDSPDWTNEIYNPIYCIDLGSEKAALFYPYGDDLWGYAWEGSDYAENYSVSMDFMCDAMIDNPMAGFAVRGSGNPTDFDFYGVVVNPAHPAHVTLGYFNEDDIYPLWVKYLEVDPEPGEWYNVKCYVSGDDPVEFEIYFDDKSIGTFTDEYFLLPAGVAGLAAYDIYDYDDIYVDNIVQEVDPPGPFRLLTPPNGATIDVFRRCDGGNSPSKKDLTAGGVRTFDRTHDPVDVDVTFTWQRSVNAEEYRLFVDDDPGFGSPEADVSGIDSETYTHTFIVTDDVTYYWRVRASNNGDEIDCTDDFHFTFNYNNVNVGPASLGRIKSAFR
jgi:hypothetical protein